MCHSSFDGYEQLAEFEADAYRTRYANIGRLDLILATEGDSPNNYRLSKQADVLMLFYLLSAEELRNIFDRLGYPLTPHTIRATVDFYTARTSHGSTLSRVVHAWVNARADRHQAWTLFTEALQADLADTQGGTTREGVHLGAMAGTVDLVLHCFAGLETRDDLLWLHPVLPPELSRAEFSILYKGQQVKVELTPRLARLRLRMCNAGPDRRMRGRTTDHNASWRRTRNADPPNQPPTPAHSFWLISQQTNTSRRRDPWQSYGWCSLWLEELGAGGSAGAPSRSLIVGPMTNADNKNIATNTANPMTGAHQEPNRRFSRSSNGMAATSPSRPKTVVPAAPATRAVPVLLRRSAATVSRPGAPGAQPPAMSKALSTRVPRGGDGGAAGRSSG
jgi:hypothetical protein